MIAVIAIILWLSKMPAAPKNYQKTTETGGEIVAKFMADVLM